MPHYPTAAGKIGIKGLYCLIEIVCSPGGDCQRTVAREGMARAECLATLKQVGGPRFCAPELVSEHVPYRDPVIQSR